MTPFGRCISAEAIGSRNCEKADLACLFSVSDPAVTRPGSEKTDSGALVAAIPARQKALADGKCPATDACEPGEAKRSRRRHGSGRPRIQIWNDGDDHTAMGARERGRIRISLDLANPVKKGQEMN
jgi:hypothetical protein